MKRLSRYDIECIAARVIKAYRNRPELEGQQIRNINPEFLTTGLLGLSLEYHHLSVDDSVLGLTSYDEIGVGIFGQDDEDIFYILDGKTVLVESDLKSDISKLGRLNFTIIHEASHQILKMLFPSDYGIQRQPHYYRATSRRQTAITDWEEWQANSLAAAILLPPELVLSGMQEVGLGVKLEMLNKIFRPVQYAQFCQLTEILGVSKSALAIRMKQLGVLSKDYLHDPYALVNIEVEDYE